MQTKIVGGGVVAPGPELIVDPSFGAARVSIRPLEYVQGGTVLGHYRVAAPTGAFAGAAAGSAIWSFRWTDTKSYAVLLRIDVGLVITTAFTTAQALDVDAIIQRAFTVADSGGTLLTPTQNSGKNRVIMGTTLVNDVRVATTAALTAGTKTPDASAFAIAALPQTNALGTGSQVNLYKWDALGQHPIVFGVNEGFNVRNVTALGAAGVVKIYIATEWAEIPSF